MFKLFIEGGAFYMGILTILLVAIFFAAWKAPRWIKEIGAFALTFGFFSLLLGLRQMFCVLQEVEGSISPGVLYGGLKVAMIPVLYGIIVYLVSLVVRVIRKPRV